MANFDSSYPSTVDAKNRFLLPAGIKKQLQENETVFMMRRGFENCIELFTAEKWNQEKARFSTLNEYDTKVRELKRKLIGSATQVEMDAAGRLLLAKELKEYAGITKDIMIMGQLDHFEIWDISKYEKIFEDYSSDSLASLAAEVFGGQKTM